MATLLDSPPEIPHLSPFGLYAHLGLVSIMEPTTETLMAEREHLRLVTDEFDSPHARAWHLSFHASEFPGDPEDACKRYLLYRMMNLPAASPMPPWVTTTGTVGKAGELDIADAWHRGGRLLSIPEDPTKPDQFQLGFADPLVWMTASTDLPILPPGWRQPHIVEVKGKADEVLEEMLKGRWDANSGRYIPRGPDVKHIRQLKATLGLANEYDWGTVAVCEKCWFIYEADIFERLTGSKIHPLSDSAGWCPRCRDYGSEGVVFDLEPPTTGEIYYWSRSWPRKTRSFYYEYDAAYMARGRSVLAETRAHFIADELPPRPDHFQWSVPPCNDCSYRPTCRLDSGLAPRKRKPVEKDIVHKLSESNGVTYAKTMRPHYNFDETAKAVAAQWSEDG